HRKKIFPIAFVPIALSISCPSMAVFPYCPRFTRLTQPWPGGEIRTNPCQGPPDGYPYPNGGFIRNRMGLPTPPFWNPFGTPCSTPSRLAPQGYPHVHSASSTDPDRFRGRCAPSRLRRHAPSHLSTRSRPCGVGGRGRRRPGRSSVRESLV